MGSSTLWYGFFKLGCSSIKPVVPERRARVLQRSMAPAADIFAGEFKSIAVVL
jgi:hypothetical protein